jgi:hypothetical protein
MVIIIQKIHAKKARRENKNPPNYANSIRTFCRGTTILYGNELAMVTVPIHDPRIETVGGSRWMVPCMKLKKKIIY